MKVTAIAAVVLLLAVAAFAEEKKPQLKDLKDRVSYAYGLKEGFGFQKQNASLKTLGTEFNADAFMSGLKDGMANKPQMTEQEIRETLMAFNKDMQAKQGEVAQKNSAEAQKFMNDNKGKDGVKTTASGLQYKVMKEGNGAQPKASDTVTVNYRGTLTDGTEFDSSYKRGQPFTTNVSGVIKGWTEALQLMKVGSKYQLFIPPDLAYGPQGQGTIPPNAVLIFEVELLDTKAGAAPFSGSQAPPPSAAPSPK